MDDAQKESNPLPGLRVAAHRYLRGILYPVIVVLGVLTYWLGGQQSGTLALYLALGLQTLLLLLATESLVVCARRRDDELRTSSGETQRLALIAQRTSNWVAVTNAQRKVLWCNEAFMRGTGWTAADLASQSMDQLVSNESNDADEMGRLQAELDMGLPVRAELLVRGRGGQQIWLDVDHQPIHDAAGVLVGFTFVAGDITDRVNQSLRLRTLLGALPVGVVLHNAEAVVLDANPKAREILGAARLIRADLTPMPQQDRPTTQTMMTGQGVTGALVGHVDSEGGTQWQMVNTAAVRDAQGRMTGVVTCMMDVTEQREQQQLLTLAIESASLGIWHWTAQSGMIQINQQLLEMVGRSGGSLVFKPEVFQELIHPDDREGWKAALIAGLNGATPQLRADVRIRHGDGRWVWALFSGTVVARDVEGKAIRMAGICYDINAQKELEEQLRHSAQTDLLTQLPNRAELLQRIRAAIQRTKDQPGYCFAVLFMDFDRFKQVNDTLGHSAGDELLRQIAQRLQDSLRPSDAFLRTSDFGQMAARIGGDEFVVLLENIRGDLDAQVVAARLLDVLAEPYQINQHRVTSTASIGIVTTAHMADDPDSVLRDADIAMYEAKRLGRGRYELFAPSLRKRVHDDVQLENDLRLAVERREIQVVYQPMMDLHSGKFSGVEALARWQHPTRGAVSPLSFIPVAESSGLIGRLGEMVLLTACRELARLRQLLAQRAPATVSVNLSRAQLRQEGFARTVSELLYASGLEPQALVLEVTESLAAQDDGVQAVLRELRAIGVTVSLDDFGTGYSSLSCLHELPVNQVKIDRSFVSQALESAYHRAMIEATISMARTLGLQTVAEGIETEEQAELMGSLGCAKGQGYLYSRPLSGQDLEQWAARLT